MYDRPKREPDIVFPKEQGFNRVEIWIAEGLFCVGKPLTGDECMDTISSTTMKLTNEKDPMVYISATAKHVEKSGKVFKRSIIAKNFLNQLDSILLGG
jgi:hypothetical protein